MVKKIKNSCRQNSTNLAENWKVISYEGRTLWHGPLRECYMFLYKNRMTEAILLAPGQYYD
tara:strand:- start:815 stop:997 length:183 start_codon:yes stop_codon:yes gene_type:complete